MEIPSTLAGRSRWFASLHSEENSWRSRQEALYAFADRFQRNVLVIDEALFIRLLRGWAPLVEKFYEHTEVDGLPKGAFLLRSQLPWGEETISVWIGARVTLMIDTNEQNMLRHKLGLPWRDEEE